MASVVETAIRSVVAKGIEQVATFNRRRMPTPPHPFLTGIHRPMRDELTLADLPVTGALPDGLKGRYLRIGPNPVDPDESAGYHWFIGDGMVHAVAIGEEASPSYRNRWIRSREVAKALGEAPAPGPRHGGFDTVNTNVLRIADRDWALVEAGSYPVELDAGLEGQAYNPFDGTLKGSFTAHPHLDPLTGEHHAIAYEATDPDTIRHVVIGADGRVARELPVAVRHGPSIHDCAITARYVVILDLPVTFSMRALIGGHRFPYVWNPEHQARVGLLPRGGGADEVIWCDVDPLYVFHVANAYDDADGRVVLDVCAYESMFAGEPGGPAGRALGLERWTIDPATRSVARRTVDAAPQEFPRIDERLFGQPYRFAYSMALPEGPEDRFIGGSRLYRHDMETGARLVHDFGVGRHPGEFVFVPARDGAAEDEGWLVGLVVDLPGETTDLAIIDARNFAAPPVATIRLPHRVPPGFHGNWFPARTAS